MPLIPSIHKISRHFYKFFLEIYNKNDFEICFVIFIDCYYITGKKNDQELPQKEIVLLTYIFNSMLKIHYWPKNLETLQIINIRNKTNA